MVSVARPSSQLKLGANSVSGMTVSLKCQPTSSLISNRRLVPPQTPENVNPLVIDYLQAEFAKLNSKNTLRIEGSHGGKPWVEDVKHWNYEAAKKATEAVYNKSPDLTREGGSIPVTLTFAETLRVNVLLLPMGRGDDGAQYVLSCAFDDPITDLPLARPMRNWTGRTT